MPPDKPDVNAVLTVRFGEQMRREWPLAVLVLALGAFMLWQGIERDRFEWLLAAALLLAFGVAMLVLPRLGMQRDNLVVAELAPSGITFDIPPAGGTPLKIGWDEVTGITRISFIRRLVTTVAIYRQEPAIRITAACLERLEKEGGIDDSILWDHYVRPGPPGTGAEIVFHHCDFGLPRFRVHEALESRWRAFSTHPSAAIKWPPVAFDQWTDAIDRVLESRVVRFAVLAGVVPLLGMAVWYWHYGVTAWLDPAPTGGQAAAYLRDLIDKDGVPALVGGRSMAVVRRADITRVQDPDCRHRIERNTGGPPGLLPRYKRASTCYTALWLTGDRRAVGVFTIDVVHIDQVVSVEYPSGREVRRVGAFRVAVVPDLAAAQVLLCSVGHCARP